MSKTWIIIANSSKAIIYETHLTKLFIPNGHDETNLKLIANFSHAASRKKASELISDRAGRYQFGTKGHGAYQQATDPKYHQAELFARELVNILNTGRNNAAYDYLIIVANPPFQGLLNKYLQQHNDLIRMVSQRIEKDYTQLQGRQLVAQLRDHL
ncbi:MAG: host attachment protein [Pseudomonadota bacterium]